MLVIGTSLRVAPVSEILPQLPASVPVLLINRELVGHPHLFDIELLGDSDEVVEHLMRMVNEDGDENFPAPGSAAGGGQPSDARVSSVSDPAEAASAVEAGDIARWLPRPSTFLFKGFAPPPSASGDSNHIESEGESSGGGIIDESGEEGEPGVADDAPVAGWERSSASEDEGGWGAHLTVEAAHEQRKVETLTVEAESPSSMGCPDDSRCALEAVDGVLPPLATGTAEGASSVRLAAGFGGYDESWGVQRPRPMASIMASQRPKKA
jgi:hypothetical protein